MNWSQNQYLQDVSQSNLLEQPILAADLKVQRLEKQIRELQDYTEDLTFKAQRHEEAAAALRSQNAFLVKKCSDLQRQLIECLSTVDVLDIRCNDAESKLKRVRLALEEKEFALLTMSGEHTTALLKIEENEREMEKVRSEMDNVNRKFMKVSCNQRELKKDLLFYKTILKARDQKIQKLLDDRLRVSTDLKERRDNGVTHSCRNVNNETLKRDLTPTVQFPEHDLCADLMKSISVGDDLLTEKMLTLESDNMKLATQVSSLNVELDNRRDIDVSRMNQILLKIGNVEDEMVSFLTLLENVAEQCPTQVKPNSFLHQGPNQSRVAGENLDLMKQQANMMEEVVTLRRLNFYLEKLIEMQVSNFGTIFQNQRANGWPELSDLEENICGLRSQGKVYIRTNTDAQQMLILQLNKGCSEPASSLETLHDSVKEDKSDELVCEESVKDFLRAVDFMRVSRICSNAYEELFRLCVLLQVCLFKMKTTVPEEEQYYLPIMSGLNGVLLKIRSTISSHESLNLNGTNRKTENSTVVTLPKCTNNDAPGEEPNTARRPQLSSYQMNKVVATTEMEARMGHKRHKILHFHISHGRLRNGDSMWPSNSLTEDKRVIQNLYSGGQHRVCTDLVVNLQRNLRASERNNLKMQEKLCAKTKEMGKLQQEMSNLRLSLEAANETLDNKRIALGRSEAIWQMLRISEASLEQRLEVEQRQHENCRQQLDKLAASLEEMRIRCEEHEVLRDDGESKQVASTLLPPAISKNRAALGNLLKHTNGRNREIIRMMDDCVSLMMNDMNLLQRHFGEKPDDSE